MTYPPPNTGARCWCDRSRYRPHPQTPEHGHSERRTTVNPPAESAEGAQA